MLGDGSGKSTKTEEWGYGMTPVWTLWSNVVAELFPVKRWGSQLVREAEASFPHKVPFMLNRCSNPAPFYLSHFLNTWLRNVYIGRTLSLNYRDIFFYKKSLQPCFKSVKIPYLIGPIHKARRWRSDDVEDRYCPAASAKLSAPDVKATRWHREGRPDSCGRPLCCQLHVSSY